MKPTKEKPMIKLSSRVVYESPWRKMREDVIMRENGEGVYGVLETNDSVMVCAINDRSELYLIYSYKYPTDVWSWQLPGGGDDGERSEVAAKRELLEETGLRAEHAESLGSLIVCNGAMSEMMSVVVATGLKPENERVEADDSSEVAGGKFVHIDEVRNMVDRGEICDSQSISSLYMLDRWFARQD